MTKDEIEKLAVEAGWPLFAIQMLAGTEDEKRLERFAALVAKAEREACAQVCERFEIQHWRGYKDNNPATRCNPHKEGLSDGAGECAAAIRARGNA